MISQKKKKITEDTIQYRNYMIQIIKKSNLQRLSSIYAILKYILKSKIQITANRELVKKNQ